MFRIAKYVSPYGLHQDATDFYLTDKGFWSSDEEDAKVFKNEHEVDILVDKLNDKADKHYCRQMSNTYRITTYVKEEI